MGSCPGNLSFIHINQLLKALAVSELPVNALLLLMSPSQEMCSPYSPPQTVLSSQTFTQESTFESCNTNISLGPSLEKQCLSWKIWDIEAFYLKILSKISTSLVYQNPFQGKAAQKDLVSNFKYIQLVFCGQHCHSTARSYKKHICKLCR